MSENSKKIAEHFDLDVNILDEVSSVYPVAISPFLTRRVQEGNYSINAVKQYYPDVRELSDVDGYVTDPTGEGELHPEEAILQTYSNRAAIIFTHQCLVYCRFCFRKDFVGISDNKISETQLEKSLSYLAQHPEIQDVLVSGGDPLAVPNSKLLPFLQKLRDIEHIQVIRIHSRALSVTPERFDGELMRFFEADNKIWYYAHMNHPDDINHPDVLAVVRKLQRAGVPVLNQAVILSGVNDDPKVLFDLMNSCYRNRVLPYNLYLLDRVKGAAHFDVSTERVVQLYSALSSLPGPAQPVLVYVDSNSKKHRTVFRCEEDLRKFLSKR